MKPITITIYRRVSFAGWEACEVLRAPTWSRAKRLALEAMGPVCTTSALYHHANTRAPHALLSRRASKPLMVCPDVEIVPSCGEVGYW